MSANYAKLRGKIVEVFGAQKLFAKEMSIDRSTLSQKLNGKSDWTRLEIQKACTLLDIPISDAHDYFFTV